MIILVILASESFGQPADMAAQAVQDCSQAGAWALWCNRWAQFCCSGKIEALGPI